MNGQKQNESAGQTGKELPSGVVTALFTDIVNSVRLNAEMPYPTAGRRNAAYLDIIKKPHDEIVLPLIANHGGKIVTPTGDGFCAVFADADEAVWCAVEIQERLISSAIPTPLGPLQVRIGLHTGFAMPSGGDVTAAAMNKASRVMSNAAGGRCSFLKKLTRWSVASFTGSTSPLPGHSI